MFRVLLIDHPWVDEEGFRSLPQHMLADQGIHQFYYLEDVDDIDRAFLAAAADSPEFEFFYYDGNDG
jgi:hypothetical protein